MERSTSENLLRFIEQNPSPYHACAAFAGQLEEAGFLPLNETAPWALQPGGSYYIVRNGSALLAFRLPENMPDHFQIAAAHSDSPAFRLKYDPELVSGPYVRLNAEKYGGAILAPWLDRPLGIAGRLLVRTESGIQPRLVDPARDLCLIPNLAIHMNRTINEGASYSAQTDLLPLWGDAGDAGSLIRLLAKEADVEEEQILDADLFLYNRVPGSIWGARNQFISSGRLDDLQCAYGIVQALIGSSAAPGTLQLAAIFDNEEIGSRTRQGADSAFLTDTLERIAESLGMSREAYLMACAGSFLVSADNSHAVHPAHPEKADPVNRPVMNGGPVLKYSANQMYTTDGSSGAVFREICRRADVPCQTYLNHSDIPGGSTLGKLSASHLSVRSVDIGLAQLAMHSPYETAGAQDTDLLIRCLRAFYSTRILCESDSLIRLET